MLTNNEYQIIDHTLTRAANKAYCASESDVASLVKRGLMEFYVKLSYVPEPYWRVTTKGKGAYLEELDRRFGAL